MTSTKYILPIFILMAAVIFSCNDGNKSSGTPSNKRDTSMVLAVYVDPTGKKVNYGLIYKVRMDSANILVQPDSITWKKSIGKDSFYVVPYFPSWQDTTTNIIYIDSLPNRKKVGAYWNTHKSFIRDGFPNADTAINQLSRLIPKQDSLNKK